MKATGVRFLSTPPLRPDPNYHKVSGANKD